MSRDRYGIDSDRLVSMPADKDNYQGDQQDQADKNRSEDRARYIQNPPFRSVNRQGPPDLSGSPTVKRYIYQKHPWE